MAMGVQWSLLVDRDDNAGGDTNTINKIFLSFMHCLRCMAGLGRETVTNKDVAAGKKETRRGTERENNYYVFMPEDFQEFVLLIKRSYCH